MTKGDKFELEFCPMTTLGGQGKERIEVIGMKKLNSWTIAFKFIAIEIKKDLTDIKDFQKI